MRIATKFEVVGTLGHGGLGVVYEAMDTVLDRRVAIKTIRDETFPTLEARHAFEARFLQEARWLARLLHPNIVAVYEAGRDADAIYLVMELVKGQTLRRVLAERGKLPITEVLPLAASLLPALDYAHAQGVAHRGVKPERLLIREDGILKIAGFGLAGPDAEALPHPGGSRSDLFGSAAVLYEALAGVRPFEPMSELPKETQEPPAALPAAAAVPIHVEAAILRGLSRSSDERFDSGGAFLASLMTAHEAALADLTATAEAAEEAPPQVDGFALPAPGAGASPVGTMDFQALGRRNVAAPVKVWTLPSSEGAAEESGSLADAACPELLLGLRRKRKSGLLVVETESWAMGVDLALGLPVGASGGPPETTIGAALAKLGYIDDAAHARLLAEYDRVIGGGGQTTLGNLAVKIGLVTTLQILAALEAQIDARIIALVGVASGTYRFYRDLSTGRSKEMSPRPIEALVLRGLRTHGSRRFQLVQDFMKRAWRRALLPNEGASEVFLAFRFGPRVQRFLDSIVDGRTVAEVLAKGLIPRADGELALYLLWAAGALALGPPQPQSTAIPRPPEPKEKPAPPPPVKKPRVERLPQVIRKVEQPRRAPQPKVEYLPRVVRPPSRAPGKADALVAQARAAMETRDFRAAQDLYEHAHASAPEDAKVQAELGWATFRAQPGLSRARSEARVHIEESLRKESRNASALVWLGTIDRVEGHLLEARSRFTAALAIDSTNAEAQAAIENIDRLRQRGGQGAKRSDPPT